MHSNAQKAIRIAFAIAAAIAIVYMQRQAEKAREANTSSQDTVVVESSPSPTSSLRSDSK